MWLPNLIQAQDAPSILKKLVNLRGDNISLEQALQSLTENYGIFFSYNPKIIPAEKKYKIAFDQMYLEQVLNQLFKGTTIGYFISDDLIILQNKSKQKETERIYVLKGQIKSQSTQEFIPLGHVYFTQRVYGSVSDYDGKFEIKVKESWVQDTLTFSAVGYQIQEIPIKDLLSPDSIFISLVDSVYSLEELEITPQKTKVGRFFAKINIFRKAKGLIKDLKAIIPLLFSRAKLDSLGNKLTFKERLKNLVIQLQILTADWKNKVLINKIIRKINRIYERIERKEAEEKMLQIFHQGVFFP